MGCAGVEPALAVAATEAASTACGESVRPVNGNLPAFGVHPVTSVNVWMTRLGSAGGLGVLGKGIMPAAEEEAVFD